MSLVNHLAPEFTLPDQNNQIHALADYRGKFVLIYFYPKDDTPGCTTEACSFREHLNDLENFGVQVFGVSADTVQSHQKFAAKFQLNFPLLADVNKAVVKAYGVLAEKSMFGKKYFGIRRDSFLIDKNGVINKHYEKVKPATHVAEVIADIKNLH